MDVYLVPMDDDRHDLYCEPVSVLDTKIAPRRGWIGRLIDRASAMFRRVLAEGEALRHAGVGDATTGGRWRRAAARRLAEVVAGQRLLWHLRTETVVQLHHPDNLDGPRALEIARAQLVHDRDKHRRWCVFDAAFTIASAPLALVPGPNVLAYYFIFRAVGHYLSMLGARQGLDAAVWKLQSEPLLTTIPASRDLDPTARAVAVDRIGDALGLKHLARFVTGARG